MKLKKLMALLLSLVCVLTLASCKDKQPSNDGKPANAPTNEKKVEHISVVSGKGGELLWNDEHDLYQAEMTYSSVWLDSGITDKYPQLAKQLDESAKRNIEIRKGVYNNLIDMSQAYLDDGTYFETCYSKENAFVRRADTNVLSILYSYQSYYGGMHPDYAYGAQNYDVKTGKLLKLSDVITDNDAFIEAVKKELKTHWSDIAYDETFDYKTHFADEENNAWLLDCNGITIIFNPYTISAYSTGVQIVTVPYEGNESFIKAEYIEKCESFTAEIAMEAPFYYDIDNDGQNNELLFYHYEDDETGCRNFVTSLDGTECEPCGGAYDYEAVFVHAADGKNYIYLECLYDNDFKDIYVYEISDGKLIDKGNTYSGFLRLDYAGPEYSNVKLVMTNPDSFMLEVRTELLSTLHSEKTYHVGADGMPVSDDDWYVFYDDERLEFTLKLNIEAEIVDEDGNGTGKMKEILKGEKLYYYRTDGDSIAELLTSDDEIVRFKVEFNEDGWTKYINGIDIGEIFDGMMFAG